MEKYFLLGEGVVMAGIFLSGFYDPSFWFFGIILIGIPVSLICAVVSWILCRKRLRAGGQVMMVFSLAVGNTVACACFVLFLLIILSLQSNYIKV